MTEQTIADLARRLREPFPPDRIGKLPRIWCGACRDARGKACSEHRRTKCETCGNNITPAHLHLDYVGHADTTDRLLEVDPAWTWEPLAFDQRGLPAVDDNGGLWIRLTVAGVTRLGYGHADGKRGGDAVKEAIGDAIRNAALRFGVALDLWRKEPAPAVDTDGGRRPPARRTARGASPEASPEAPERLSDGQRRAIMAGFSGLNLGGPEHREQRLTISARLAGLESLASTTDLTAEQARAVLDGIAERKRAQTQPAEPTP